MHQHYAGIVVLLLSGCGNIKSVVTAPTSATAIDAVISDRKANMPPVMALANISAPLEILKSENDLGKADFGETRLARFLLR
ncbi:MAG TPA: hypothetical protein PKD72_12325, partial [Gemmatales bacterium]|nr:hypothetical protein [Gemmatales bacterium]